MVETQGNVYYVAVNGDDRNDGRSEQSPFRTIGRAAETLKAGDVCYIREGVYRETVVPGNSGRDGAPIRFEAYRQERVVVSGCDEIKEWAHHEGNVYKASLAWELVDGGDNLVFFDGELGMEAQWPNMSDRLDKTQYATVDSATNDYTGNTLFDADLQAFPDGYWDGAMVACVNGVSYFMSTAKVNRFQDGTLHHDQWINSAEHYHTEPGNLYFITRTLRALDSEKEWYYDPRERLLYVIVPGGGHPAGRTVEAKRRDYAFDLSGKQHIHIAGIHCRGASITTKAASHCQIRGGSIYGMDRSFGWRQTIYGRTNGVELGGSDNVLRDCEISHFEGIGVQLSGERNTVVNCFIHDGNFEASYASMIWLTGFGHRVSRCTISRSGRTAISGVFARSVIEYCDISFANALTKDSGMIYLFNHDFDSTHIHHNWLHDNLSDHLSFGFYMDAWTSGVSFYRNVVWNIPDRGMVLNRPLQRTLIYNNTFYRRGIADSTIFYFDDMYGTHMANNLFAAGEIRKWGNHSVVSHNRFDEDPRFENAEQGDFRLRPESPAIGKGIPIEGITDGFLGEAPDVGAYEQGGESWVPGHDFDRSQEAGEGFAVLDHETRIRNGGFETGDLAHWSVASGSPATVFECGWDYSRNGSYPAVVRSNKYAAVLQPGDRIEQRAEGLKPNTSYIAYAAIRSSGEYRLAVEHSDSRSTGSWEQGPDGGRAIYRDVPYIGPAKKGEWLKFAGVDFGLKGKYDNVSIGLNKVVGPVSIECRLDHPDGPLIGAITQQTNYDSTWRHFTAPIGFVEGMHDVYLKFVGEGRCLIHNVLFHHATRAGSARMSVSGHGEAEAKLLVSRWNWESTMSELHFTTGPEATSATVAIENGTAAELQGYSIYVDDCGLWAKPEQGGGEWKG
ncbi:right-handed parallel beta-helix repeat-containing protein [Paenibacillus hodogayensis]|uniref:Right-handed parallel beta-helix repeat-containing protein n=1 Tax=Paenibacillus hodogayensis TaxID=279208 RepID=A0ABV5VRM7_9BACL